MARASAGAVTRGWSAPTIAFLACILPLVASCGPSPKDLLGLFFKGIEERRYEEVADLVRAKDGSPLTAASRQELIAAWRRAFEREGVTFHVSRVVNTGEQPVSPQVLRVAGATRGVQVTVDLEGTSTHPCLRLPVRNVTALTVEIAGRWYLIQTEYDLFDFRHCGQS